MKSDYLIQKLKNDKFAAYVFVLPFMIGFVSFILFPMLMSLFFSFTRYNILSSPKFIGIENYLKMFTDDRLFWKSFSVTMYYVFFSVPLRLVMALLIALLLAKKTSFSGFYRAILNLPYII